MSIRFRKSKKILPGVRLNFSKRGVGVSMGVKGAHVSTGPAGSRVSAGIPGTGLYAVQKIGGKKAHGETQQVKPQRARGKYYLSWWRGILGFLLLFVFFGMLFSGIDSFGVFIVNLLFLAIAALLLLPWLRLLIDLIKQAVKKPDEPKTDL